jgi:type III pantothenate kinase
MVARFVAEMGGGDDIRVIGTGGIAPLIAEHTKTLQVVDVNLTLVGLRLAHERLKRK